MPSARSIRCVVACITGSREIRQGPLEGFGDLLAEIDGVLDDLRGLLRRVSRPVDHLFEIGFRGRERRGIAGCHPGKMPIEGRPKRWQCRARCASCQGPGNAEEKAPANALSPSSTSSFRVGRPSSRARRSRASPMMVAVG